MIWGDFVNSFVVEVFDVIKVWYVDFICCGKFYKQVFMIFRVIFFFLVLDDFGNFQISFFIVIEDSSIDEISYWFGVECSVIVNKDDGVSVGVVSLMNRDIGQVNSVEYVGVV